MHKVKGMTWENITVQSVGIAGIGVHTQLDSQLRLGGLDCDEREREFSWIDY